MKTIKKISILLVVVLQACNNESTEGQKISSSQYYLNNMDTALTFSKGTTIVLENETFENVDSVFIECKEIYSIKDILLNNLHTYSDSGLLITGGMIRVDFYNSNKKNYKLKPKKNIKVVFPNQDTSMFIFRGDTIQDKMIWKSDYIKTGFITLDDVWVGYNLKNNRNFILQNSFDKWINLDKYLENQELSNLYVSNKIDLNTSFYLVFKEFNSVMTAGLKDNKIIFSGVPIGFDAVILSIEFVEDDKVKYSIKDVNTKEENILLPKASVVSLNDFSVLLDKTFGKDIWTRPKPML
ncbi:MAG: hypothetical protein ACLGGV_01415 [Bacteroidia bacterium]